MNAGRVLARATVGVMLAASLPWASARATEPKTELLASGPVQHVTRPVPGLEGRVQTLTKTLGLSPAQQAQLRTVLQEQRDQIARVWNDASMPAAVKVGATQTISDRTVEQIRRFLSDSQRAKYIQPRQRDVAVGVGGADLAAWMAPGGLPATGR